MNVYVTHPRWFFDYQNGLYLPMRKHPRFGDHNFVFPCEGRESFDFDAFLGGGGSEEDCDLVVAEVSRNSFEVRGEINKARDKGAKVLGLCAGRVSGSMAALVRETAADVRHYANPGLIVPVILNFMSSDEF